MDALTLGSSAIRAQDDLYSLNDLHATSGGAARHQPSNFLRLSTTQALISEIRSSDVRNAVATSRNGGTWVCRELVVAYAAWVSAAFHLKVIRVFLASSPAPALPREPRERRYLITTRDGEQIAFVELSPDMQVISPADAARQAHAAKIAELERALAQEVKRAHDHRVTAPIYERSTKPGHRAVYLGHLANAAQAEWHAEQMRDDLRRLAAQKLLPA